MIGVVVWSNAEKEKAVVWCEDQASLAYLQGRVELLAPGRWPEPGDLVELDSELIGNLRHARRVSVLSERGCPQLPELLRSSGGERGRESHLRLVPASERKERGGCTPPFPPLPVRASAGR
ncbi:hypothetical protein [Paracoccus marinaquae]|uniref:Uncharacterized protein n=1 Tax=Paracoccus marinaquae TaxID=2841926 RepID=A0ABS6AIU9_9RHOB|nr:hypothetical protein [Paracoccus marinaquae]MBU3030524.1 hypothetical protein [Paracoccus marinaquae]